MISSISFFLHYSFDNKSNSSFAHATNNTCCATASVTLYQTGNTTGLAIANANNQQGTFTTTTTTPATALPAWFTPGAQLNVVMGIAYAAWYINAGSTVTVTLTYV